MNPPTLPMTGKGSQTGRVLLPPQRDRPAATVVYFCTAAYNGEFDSLAHALEVLEFQPARDRLFTLGDLIDRGPRSADALRWLETGRFAGSVRGNHEQMMMNALITETPFGRRMSGASAISSANGGD